ncbi:MAG: DNA-binding transcriptional ArsR family regulator [Candidatus Omnitrophota bacterium]|jgi:DNA-binding transcriptional ArsR family regulator
MKKINLKTIQNAARILRVMSHPDRLRIVEALEHSSKSVTELMNELKLAQVIVSKHLAALKKQNIVSSVVAAHFRHYSIANSNVINILNCLRSHGGVDK